MELLLKVVFGACLDKTAIIAFGRGTGKYETNLKMAERAVAIKVCHQGQV